MEVSVELDVEMLRVLDVDESWLMRMNLIWK